MAYMSLADIDLNEMAKDILARVDDLDAREDSDGELSPGGGGVDDAVHLAVALEKGMRVQARFGGGRRWYEGKVVKIRPVNPSEGALEETYDILYLEGDKEFEVRRHLIRPMMVMLQQDIHSTLDWVRSDVRGVGGGGGGTPTAPTSPYEMQRKRRAHVGGGGGGGGASNILSPPGSPSNPHRFDRRRPPREGRAWTHTSRVSSSSPPAGSVYRAARAESAEGGLEAARLRSISACSVDSTSSVNTVGTVHSIHDVDELFPGQRFLDPDLDSVALEGGSGVRGMSDLLKEEEPRAKPRPKRISGALDHGHGRLRHNSDPVDLETILARVKQTAREQTLAYRGGKILLHLWRTLRGKY
jgi:hypothetical protein